MCCEKRPSFCRVLSALSSGCLAWVSQGGCSTQLRWTAHQNRAPHTHTHTHTHIHTHIHRHTLTDPPTTHTHTTTSSVSLTTIIFFPGMWLFDHKLLSAMACLLHFCHW